MSLEEILAKGGVAVAVLLTLVQIAPIKINPWSWIVKMLGKLFYSPVMSELGEIKKGQDENRRMLNAHIEIDDERHADSLREKILRFNTELLRDLDHTHEDFIEILGVIDAYELYCKEHKEYKNSRAVYAIENIGRVYKDRLRKHDFLDLRKEG